VQTHQFYVGFVGSRGRTLFVPTIPYDFLRFSPSRFAIAFGL